MRNIFQRIANLIGRGTVAASDDTKKMQLLQVALLDTETRDDVERVQNYGFTSRPVDGAEAVTVFVGGVRDHGLVIAVDDRRYRLRSLAQGEVAVYDQTGSKIVLKANGDIEVEPSSGTVRLTGDLEVSGDITSEGTVTGDVDVIGGGKSLKNHTHTAGSYSVAVAPGPVANTSGAPV